MNKKMRELMAKIKAKFKEAATLNGEAVTKKAVLTPEAYDELVSKAAGLMDECDALQAEFDVEKRFYDRERSLVPDEMEEDETKKMAAPSGFAVIAKFLRREELTDTEKALITGTNATNGENYLIPEDVDTTIRELRKTYVSARELVTIIPTESLTGGFTFEKKAPAGLVDFSDGSDIPAGSEPQFERKNFTIKLKGMLIPVSNVLTGAERASLTAYLNTWFVKNAIISENTDIFAALKKGKTAKALAGLDTLEQSMNLDLDPSCLIGAVIVTNQSGFNAMSQEKDANGRSLLEPDPKNPTQRIFKGFPVKVYPDATLANVEGKAPVFYGNTQAGCYYIDFANMMFEASAHAGFKNNTTLLRVIEGYDVIGADVDAYCYGLYAAPTAAPTALMSGEPVALMGGEPVAPVGGDGGAVRYTEGQLKAKTKEELLAIATEKGVAGLPEGATNAVIIAAILAAQTV